MAWCCTRGTYPNICARFNFSLALHSFSQSPEQSLSPSKKTKKKKKKNSPKQILPDNIPQEVLRPLQKPNGHVKGRAQEQRVAAPAKQRHLEQRGRHALLDAVPEVADGVAQVVLVEAALALDLGVGPDLEDEVLVGLLDARVGPEAVARARVDLEEAALFGERDFLLVEHGGEFALEDLEVLCLVEVDVAVGERRRGGGLEQHLGRGRVRECGEGGLECC